MLTSHWNRHVGAAMALCLVATLASLSASAPALGATPKATLMGMRYDDGLDSRLAAQHLNGALAALGYASTAHTGGRSAADAWGDGLSDAVFGAFGHANAGIFQTDEGPTDPQDQILAAGNLWDVSAGNWWFWGNYLHYLDVDDMRLAVFAGCYTANRDPYLDSFGNVGEERGVDSIVGFTGLVYYPAFCTSCDYSGNYFWGRFAAYAQAGDTTAVALGKARNDLVAKEGNAGGWSDWKFDGALDRPGDARLSPAGPGVPWNSRPFGIDPFDLLVLTTASQRHIEVDGREVVDTETVEGVSYRRDADTGELLWLTAPASVEGDSRLSEEEARRRAVAFAEEHVPWFDASAGELTSRAVSHEDDDLLLAVQWRLRAAGMPGPGIVDVEVDRRTGSVVAFSAARVTPARTDVRVGEADAVAMARTAARAQDADIVSARLEVWDRARWAVVLDRAGDRLTPDEVVVLLDASSGDVLAVTAT